MLLARLDAGIELDITRVGAWNGDLVVDPAHPVSRKSAEANLKPFGGAVGPQVGAAHADPGADVAGRHRGCLERNERCADPVGLAVAL